MNFKKIIFSLLTPIILLFLGATSFNNLSEYMYVTVYDLQTSEPVDGAYVRICNGSSYYDGYTNSSGVLVKEVATRGNYCVDAIAGQTGHEYGNTGTDVVVYIYDDGNMCTNCP